MASLRQPFTARITVTHWCGEVVVWDVYPPHKTDETRRWLETQPCAKGRECKCTTVKWVPTGNGNSVRQELSHV